MAPWQIILDLGRGGNDWSSSFCGFGRGGSGGDTSGETWLVLTRLTTVACEICARGDTVP